MLTNRYVAWSPRRGAWRGSGGRRSSEMIQGGSPLTVAPLLAARLPAPLLAVPLAVKRPPGAPLAAARSSIRPMLHDSMGAAVTFGDAAERSRTWASRAPSQLISSSVGHHTPPPLPTDVAP